MHSKKTDIKELNAREHHVAVTVVIVVIVMTSVVVVVVVVFYTSVSLFVVVSSNRMSDPDTEVAILFLALGFGLVGGAAFGVDTDSDLFAAGA